MMTEREKYLTSLLKTYNKIKSKLTDLDILSACLTHFGDMTIGELDHAMNTIEQLWLKDETPRDVEDYAYAVNEYMIENDLTFNQLEDKYNWKELLDICYQYYGY